jgi:predicted Zn-dependent protease
MEMFSPQKLLTRSMALLITATLIFSSIFSTAAATDFDLPDFGDPSGSIMSPEDERRLGQAFMRSVNRAMKIETDPLLIAYIESLGAHLVENSGDANQPFSFFIVRDPAVNAFAGPAGNIGIHTGLILTTESESELASVVAHEIAHVTQKHLARTFDMASGMGFASTAAIIAALVLGAASKNSDLGRAAAVGVQAGMMQKQINFTRENEKEADNIGMRILADSKFDPRAMPTFFMRLGKVNMAYESYQLPEFLRTHPISKNRMAEAMGRAETYPYKQYKDSKAYNLTYITLREQKFSNPGQAINFFKKTLRDGRYRNADAHRYGLARAYIRAHKYQDALKLVNQLLSKNPNTIHYLIAKSEILYQTKQIKQALSTLKKGLRIHPGNYPLTVHYANTLMHSGQAAKAEKLLEKLIKIRPFDPAIYKLAAVAAGKAKHNSQGHYFLAEHHYLTGDLTSAQRQLEVALNNPSNNYYLNAKMAARLKEIKQEQHDLNKRRR